MLGSLYRGLTGSIESLGFGGGPPLAPESCGPYDLMVHGASAGEVRAGDSWLRSVLGGRPNLRVLRTTGSAAGLQAGADVRLPRDLPGATARFLDRASPRALILTEGELWPNLLHEAKRREIPIGVVGARMSPRTERGWALAGRSGRSVLGLVTAWATASSGAQEALLRLGVDPKRIAHTGWLKWPQVHSTPRRTEGPQGRGPTFVLGNVYPGEIEMLVPHLRGGPLCPSSSHWVLVLRHDRNEGAVRQEATQILPRGSWTVEARFGTLDGLYATADAIFVGGGGKGRGVHDLLAPLAHGHPPLCFLRGGDPGAVGETLAPLGLVLPLDVLDRSWASQPSKEAGTAALQPSAWTWSRLVSEFDGRGAATAWLQEQAVLP